MGLYRTSGDIGFVIGPPLLGLIADWTSYSMALMVNAGLMAATALLFLAARETAGRPVPRPAEPPASRSAEPVPEATAAGSSSEPRPRDR